MRNNGEAGNIFQQGGFISYLLSGLGLGSVYAIIALGYTMVYGIAKMLNFAHGDIIMIGAYTAFFTLTRFSLPPVLALLAAMAVCTVLGVVIERLAYKPLRQATSLSVLITAIGVSYFLQNAAQILWSSSTKVFPAVVENATLQLGSLEIISTRTFLLYSDIAHHAYHTMIFHKSKGLNISPLLSLIINANFQ